MSFTVFLKVCEGCFENKQKKKAKTKPCNHAN